MFSHPNSSTEEKPNHMIVWLDQNIGKPDEYQHLKHAFSSTTDPNHACPIKLIDKEYDDMHRALGNPEFVIFEGVWFLLAAFTNAEACTRFLEQNSDKRVFLITSGQMGRVAVPLILLKCPNMFIDSVTGESYSSIYVFCHNTSRQMDWVQDYCDYVQIFNFDRDLLVRMIRDIADDFVIKSKRLLEENPPNNLAAKNRLDWAYTLYSRYKEMEENLLRKEFTEVSELMEKVEKAIREASSSDNED